MVQAIGILLNIEPFEYQLVEMGLSNWILVPIISRVFIALEFIVALFLLLRLNPKKVTAVVGIIIVVFNLYVISWLLLTENTIISENYFPFSIPLIGALLLSIAILALCMIYLRQKPTDFKYRIIKYILPFAILPWPFIWSPLAVSDMQYTGMENVEDMAQDTVFQKYPDLVQFISTDDPVLLSYFSTNCPHCALAARKLKVAQKSSRFPELKIVFWGNNQDVNTFNEFTGTEFDFLTIENLDFIKLCGPSFPTLKKYSNGKLVNSWNGRGINYAVMQNLDNGKN